MVFLVLMIVVIFRDIRGDTELNAVLEIGSFVTVRTSGEFDLKYY